MGSVPKKILVVDDDEMILELIADTLREEGFEVVTASDGKKALEILFTQSFPVILSDIDMPHLTGLALLERVKKSDHEIRVILMTGYDTERNFDQALYKGAFNFIEKPFDRDIVIDAVKEAFGRDDD